MFTKKSHETRVSEQLNERMVGDQVKNFFNTTRSPLIYLFAGIAASLGGAFYARAVPDGTSIWVVVAALACFTICLGFVVYGAANSRTKTIVVGDRSVYVFRNDWRGRPAGDPLVLARQDAFKLVVDGLNVKVEVGSERLDVPANWQNRAKACARLIAKD